MKNIVGSCCLVLAFICMAAPIQAQESWTDQLSNAVILGKVSLDFRYRFEHVDQENFSKNANASTLRSRITLASAPLSGFAALLEFDDVSTLGTNDYNSTENGKTQYPVIADPTGTDFNQAWIQYAGQGYWGQYGRQRILHGNQRFIGGVAWRQNEQTFDGFRANWHPSQTLKLDLSYVYNVSRVFGPDDGSNPADLKGENYFFRADYQVVAGHTLIGYGYWLDFDLDRDFAAGATVNKSSDTLGVKYRGAFDWLSVAAAYATQTEAGTSELNYDADYWLLELGATYQSINLTVGYEVLGAGDGVGFQTPLATLHGFQGRADKFLTTPDDGVEDFYLGANGKVGPVKLTAVYHDFQAEDSHEKYGTEWDLAVSWPLHKYVTVSGHYAVFSADSERYDDTEKVWFTTQLKF